MNFFTPNQANGRWRESTQSIKSARNIFQVEGLLRWKQLPVSTNENLQPLSTALSVCHLCLEPNMQDL